MSANTDAMSEAWRWVRTAPLPVVLVFVLALATWVYAIDTEQRVEVVKSAAVARQVDSIDTKLDKLLDGVAELRAEQQRVRHELWYLPAPTHKEK